MFLHLRDRPMFISLCICVRACLCVCVLVETITDSTNLSSGVLTCPKSCGVSENALQHKMYDNMIKPDVIIISANLGAEEEHGTAHIT
jgi:hypothetical protein